MAAEPMQIDVAPEENENSPAPRVLESANIDLETYAASYQGLARLNRLMHIADHCMALQIDALKMSLSLVQSTLNVSYYHIIHKRLQDAVNAHSRNADGVNLSMPALDFQWVEATQKKASLKLEKLDNDLKNYRSNSIKESIRRGNDDLGDHHLDCCELNAALKCYSRSRDYCTSPKHVVNMCLNVIKVSVYLQNWAHVISYVNKAESTTYLTESPKDVHVQQIATKLKAAAGLAELAMGRYKQAAKLFLQANFDYVEFPELMSANNICVYGTLCALATFDRQELQKSLISSSTFKLFLELEPQLRDVVHCFYNSKYASCLKHLSEIKDNLYLDVYLMTHVDHLYALIRNKALCQYFSPYKSADLLKMSTSFNCTCADLEEEVIKLILDGKINARIDSHNKILFAKDTDKRSETFERAFDVSKEIKKRTSALIIRTAVLQNQIQVKSIQRGTQPMEMSIVPGTSSNRN